MKSKQDAMDEIYRNLYQLNALADAIIFLNESDCREDTIANIGTLISDLTDNIEKNFNIYRED